MVEVFGALSMAFSARNPLLRFSLMTRRTQKSIMACLEGMSYKFGEVNRYSKDHQDPVSIDHVPVQHRQAVKEVKHTVLKYEPLVVQDIKLLDLLPVTSAKTPEILSCNLVRKSLLGKPK